MKGKGSGWRNESRRHSLARRGIRTAQNDYSRTKVNESSGIWFESDGIGVSELLSLAKMVGFDDLLSNNKASGIQKDQYEEDGKQIIVFPSKETERSAKWLLKEYTNGDRKRKKQIKRILGIAVKEIDNKLGKTQEVEVRVDLHKSRKLLNDLEKELN